jgi:hypothetical protein
MGQVWGQERLRHDHRLRPPTPRYDRALERDELQEKVDKEEQRKKDADAARRADQMKRARELLAR